MQESIIVFFKNNIDIMSLLIGIGSFALSIVAMCKSDSAKSVANEAKKDIINLIRDRKNTGVIQTLIMASESIRDVLKSSHHRKKEREDAQEKINKQLDVLSDNKKRLKNINIERKIDFLISIGNSSDLLKQEIGVFISDLKLIKDQNDLGEN